MDIEHDLKEGSFINCLFKSSLEVMNPGDVDFGIDVKIVDSKSSSLDKIEKSTKT